MKKKQRKSAMNAANTHSAVKNCRNLYAFIISVKESSVNPQSFHNTERGVFR